MPCFVDTGQRLIQCNFARGRGGIGIQRAAVAPQAGGGSQERPDISSVSAPHVCGQGGWQDPGLAPAHSQGTHSTCAAVCFQQGAS